MIAAAMATLMFWGTTRAVPLRCRLQAAASGVRMKRLASCEAPFLAINSKKGKPLDYLADLTAMLDGGARVGAAGYFMVDIVGGTKFLPLMFESP